MVQKIVKFIQISGFIAENGFVNFQNLDNGRKR